MDIYNEIKTALLSQIEAGLLLAGEEAEVYPVYFQNIPMFPAVAIQIERRKKLKKGVSRIYELELDLNVWTYVKILDYVDAEVECLRLTEIVEQIIESDKTLNGTAMYLKIDDELDFGVVESPDGIFLQGSKMILKIKKRIQEPLGGNPND